MAARAASSATSAANGDHELPTPASLPLATDHEADAAQSIDSVGVVSLRRYLLGGGQTTSGAKAGQRDASASATGAAMGCAGSKAVDGSVAGGKPPESCAADPNDPPKPGNFRERRPPCTF